MINTHTTDPISFYFALAYWHAQAKIAQVIGEEDDADHYFYRAYCLVESVAQCYLEGSLQWSPEIFLSHYPAYQFVFDEIEEEPPKLSS